MSTYPPIKRPLTEEESNKVKDNLGLAKSIAKKMARSDQDYEELVQHSSLALMHAVRRFDNDRGTALSTYAYPKMFDRIIRANFQLSHLVHIPQDAQYKAIKRGEKVRYFVDYDEKEIEHKCDERPDPEELFLHKELSQNLIDSIDIASKRLHEKGKRGPRFTRYPSDIGKQIVLRCILGKETLKDIGDKYGVTNEAIRKVKTNMLSHLRAVLQDKQAI